MQIREIMTSPAITVTPQATVQEVVRLMRSQVISGVPVVDANGSLLGIITELHLIERNAPTKEPSYISVLSGLIPIRPDEYRQYKERLREVLATTAGELMDATDIATVAPDDTVETALTLMCDPRNTLLPVIDNDQIVGVVTRTDLVQLIETLEGKMEETRGETGS